MRNLLLCFPARPGDCLSHPRPQTVGLQLHSAGSADDGYVLLAPIAYTRTYLMDKCGREVHRWSSAYRAGQAAYLLPDGSLLRPAGHAPTPPLRPAAGAASLRRLTGTAA